MRSDELDCCRDLVLRAAEGGGYDAQPTAPERFEVLIGEGTSQLAQRAGRAPGVDLEQQRFPHVAGTDRRRAHAADQTQ
jgi:hypothetical protein